MATTAVALTNEEMMELEERQPQQLRPLTNEEMFAPDDDMDVRETLTNKLITGEASNDEVVLADTIAPQKKRITNRHVTPSGGTKETYRTGFDDPNTLYAESMMAIMEPFGKEAIIDPASSLVRTTAQVLPKLGMHVNRIAGLLNFSLDYLTNRVSDVTGLQKGGAFEDWYKQAYANADTIQRGMDSVEIMRTSPDIRNKKVWENPEILYQPELWIESTGDAMTSFIPMIVAAYASGGSSLVAGATGGILEASTMLDGMLNEGKASESEMMGAAMAYGMASTLLNRLGFKAITNNPNTRNIISKIGKMFSAGGTEAFTEWAEEPTEAFIQTKAEGGSYKEALMASVEAAKNVDVAVGAFAFGLGGQVVTQKRAKKAEEKTLKAVETARVTRRANIVVDKLLSSMPESDAKLVKDEFSNAELQEIALDQLQNDSETFDSIEPASAITEEQSESISNLYNVLAEEGVIDKSIKFDDEADQYQVVKNALELADAQVEDTFVDNVVEDESTMKATISASEAIESEEKAEWDASAEFGEPTVGERITTRKDAAKTYDAVVALINRPKENETGITSIKKKSRVARIFDPMRSVVRRGVRAEALKAFGNAGTAVWDKTLNSDKWSYGKSADAISELDTVLGGMSEQDASDFHKYVRNEIPTPDNMKEAVEVWRKWAADVAGLADGAGIRVKTKEGEKRLTKNPKYYPDFISNEFWDLLLDSKENWQKLLRNIADEHGMTVVEAQSWLDSLMKNKASIYGHLERPKIRIGKDTIMIDGKEVQVYERDPRVILDRYIMDAYSRIGDAREFGAKLEKVHEYYVEALDDGYDIDDMRIIVQRLLGEESRDPSWEKFSQWARAYNNITKLSLGGVTNTGDISKAFVMFGGKHSLLGILDMFNKTNRLFSEQAGISETELQKYGKEHGLNIGRASEWIYDKSQFKRSEMMVRRIAANAAVRFVDNLHKKLRKNPDNAFAIRRLKYLGLDPDVVVTQEKLTEQDHLTAARNSIFETQPVSRTDVPHAWRSNQGRVMTQYKTFAHKHARFLKKYVVDEARKGNMYPMLWMFVMSQALGEPLRLLKGLIRGKKKPTLIGTILDEDKELLDSLTIMMENGIHIGGMGMPSEMIEAITGYRPVESILKSIVGPSFSDVVSYAVAGKEDIFDTAIGEPEFTPLGKKSKKGQRQAKTAKKVLRSVPFIGPVSTEYVFPSNQSMFEGNNRGGGTRASDI